MIKRISAIACSILCAFLMVAPTFSRKTSRCDVVASALTLDDIEDGLYSIPLPSYNSINEYVGGHNPLPLVAVIGKNSFALQRSYDGITVDDLNLANSVWFAPLVYGGEIDDIKYPMYLQGAGEDTVTGKLAMYVSSFTLSNVTDEEFSYYRPYRLTGYYIFPEIQGDVQTRDHLYIDFYVDYIDSRDKNNIVRGAGFSLRLPFNMITYDPYFESDYFHLGDDDVYPVGNYLCYQSENILGYRYTSYNGILYKGYFQGIDEGYDVGYDVGHDEGYDLGHDEGYGEGYSEGHSIGVGEGYDEGYDVGYNAGIEKANTFTFNSLISAVIDVPINAIRSVLNFNILGVDMATFFFSLFTLGVVLTIVRMLL